MANPRILVVKLDKAKAMRSGNCNPADEKVCAMRRKSHANKRNMYSCTESGMGIDACMQVNGGAGLLERAVGESVAPSFAVGGLVRPSWLNRSGQEMN